MNCCSNVECHPDNMQVDIILKAISDLILQEFKSIRQDMKMEFAQMQENMEDIVSKILAETKIAETMNNAIPIEKTLQPSVVESDIGICIEGDYSEKASVHPQVEAIKEEPLLLEEYEVLQTETDDSSISMLNKFPTQSDIGVNATVKTVKCQRCVERNSDEECSNFLERFLYKPAASDGINACNVNAQVFVANNREKRFSCKFCDKSFKRKINLRDHIRTHTGECPYQCQVCEKSFTIKCNLTTHMNIHTGERPYQCQVCEKSFIKKCNLTTHMNIHTGEWPYQWQE
ncbi:unnamed protein product [Clavelina lepadiformis]|uniref:C2H2-type domain-containing protein n=1 Tax=Clavelina lepadiformis TaxID=159417 RepID=A0ABP0GIE9_CLALP